MDPASGGGGGGGTATWRDSLPEDIRADPLLASVKDINDLAKGYVHGQRMLGDRVPKPKPDWKPEQWNEFWTHMGRPAEHSKYKVPEFQFPEGFPAIDPARLEPVLKSFHGLGLTQQQLEGVMKVHFENLSGEFKSQAEARNNAHAQVMTKLAEKFGDSDKVGHVLERTRNAIKKLGGESGDFDSLLDFITDKGLDNNYEFLVMMSRVGEMMQEDRARGGHQGQGFVESSAAAASEIERLTMDSEFQKVLNDPRAPGHKEAVNRWLHVHGVAHPGKQKE